MQVSGQSNCILSLGDIELSEASPWAGLAEGTIADADASPADDIRIFQARLATLRECRNAI